MKPCRFVYQALCSDIFLLYIGKLNYWNNLSCQGCFGCLGRRKQSDAFLQAVRDGAVSSIATVIEHQPDLAKSTTTDDKKNALHVACEEGHVVVLNAVLEVLTCQESLRTDTDAGGIPSIINAQVCIPACSFFC